MLIVLLVSAAPTDEGENDTPETADTLMHDASEYNVNVRTLPHNEDDHCNTNPLDVTLDTVGVGGSVVTAAMLHGPTTPSTVTRA